MSVGIGEEQNRARARERERKKKNRVARKKTRRNKLNNMIILDKNRIEIQGKKAHLIFDDLFREFSSS